MSHYPGYPPPFNAAWTTHTSTRSSFPLGGLHVPALGSVTGPAGASSFSEPAYLPSLFRSPLIDPLSPLSIGQHFHRPLPASSRYLSPVSDLHLPPLGLEPLYGFGPQEPRNLLLSPNFVFSQNPSPLTFDQIYRSGTSSVSPVSQYRSSFDDRSIGTCLNVPGRFSEPLRQDQVSSSKFVKPDYPFVIGAKSSTSGECENKQEAKIWNPFGDDKRSETEKQDKVTSKACSAFSIDALTAKSHSEEKEPKSETVDANGNVTKCASENIKLLPERPKAHYPIRPVPVFSSGISRLVNVNSNISYSLNQCSAVSGSLGNSSVHIDLTEADDCVSESVDQSQQIKTKVEHTAGEKNELRNDSNGALVNITKSIECSKGCAIEENKTDNREKKAKSSESDQTNDSKDSTASENVQLAENSGNKAFKKHIVKDLHVSLPVLRIEIPQTSKADNFGGLKSPELCSPKSCEFKVTSPTKGSTSRKDELLILSQQVNEVRKRRRSKELLSPSLVSPNRKGSNSVSASSDTKVLSPTLLSPKKVKKGNSVSAKSSECLLSPLSENCKKSKPKCSKVVARRWSLPDFVSRRAQNKRSRMSSTEGAISMLKSTEDSMSASISSSHLTDSDSDTQMSNDNTNKTYPESQPPLNTQTGFQENSGPHVPVGSQGYLPSYGVEGMNNDNHYYKMNPPQLCQSEPDNQKPYPCVQGQRFNEKPEILPPYNCYAANQSPGSVLPREPSFHSQEENSNFTSNLPGVDSSMDYDENSVMSDPGPMHPPSRCDSQSSVSNASQEPVLCKDGNNQVAPTQPSQEFSVPDEGQWDFLHSKQYIENIYSGHGCEAVKSESDEIRETDSPKVFIDLDKTTKEKKAQEGTKGNSKEGYGSKNYGKQFSRQVYSAGGQRTGLYGNQSFDNYNHMAGNRWGNFNRGDPQMGSQPNHPSGENFSGQQFDQAHQYRNNFQQQNYQNMSQSQNGGDKPQLNPSNYHGNEYNQNESFYNQNPPGKNFQGNHGNYGNGRYENGYYQNRGGNEFNSQNNMYPPTSNEQPSSRYPSQGFSGPQGNYSQHYNQQSSHCPPENMGQYHPEMSNFSIPRNASPASTGSEFNMEAPGVVPKKKRGRKRKIDKEPPDENKPRPNTIVMAPTKLGPMVDVDNPECTIDTYDYNNQIETIFNFSIEDDLSPIGAQFLQIEQRLCQKMLPIKYGYPVTVIYSPLTYAFQTHRDFVAKYCTSERTLLFLGMNPGPYGMSQNGVPFGEACVTRDWLKITGDIYKPEIEHPKKPVTGLACTRNEVSGARFWGLFQKVCKVAENFFKNSYVYNFCPLAYMSESGKNVTPPQLVHSELDQINETCDVALVELVKLMNIRVIVAVGKFVQQRASKALHNAGIMNVKVECILHPSPINPHANKGWEQIVAKQLIEMNVMHYLNPDMEDVQRCIEEWERIAQSNIKIPPIEKADY